MTSATEVLAGDAKPSRLPRRNFSQRLAVFGPAIVPSRGRRFLNRRMPPVAGEQIPKLADLACLPDWILLDEEQVQEIASVVTLLHFRNQLDTILDGEQLRQICEMCGEEYFDLVCDAPIPNEDMCAAPGDPLPPMEQLRDYGKRLLIKALPSILANRFDGASGDPNMLILANLATTIVASRRQALQGDDLQ